MLVVEPADRVERKRRGAWYTPPAVVDLLVDQAVVPALDDAARRGWPAPVRVLDPACGDGRVLAAASVAAARCGAPPGALELIGIELDASTAAQARLTVPEARIEVGDGRSADPGGSFDAVVGNPPYLGQMARATSRGGRSRLGGGPYADVAAEFLLRAVELARPDGGRVALVLPQSVLVTRDTETIRAAVRRQAAVTGLWWAGSQVFEAGVHVCVVVLQRGREQGPVARWRGPEMAPLAGRPRRGSRRFDVGAAHRRRRRGPRGPHRRRARPPGRPGHGDGRVPAALLRPGPLRQRRRGGAAVGDHRPHRSGVLRLG